MMFMGAKQIIDCKTIQLNAARNSSGLWFVLLLNNLLNDCEYSKPNSYAISLTDKDVVESFSFAYCIIFHEYAAVRFARLKYGAYHLNNWGINAWQQQPAAQ
jgi:hypothetical protein